MVSPETIMRTLALLSLFAAPVWAVTDDPWTTKPQKLSERMGTTTRPAIPVTIPPKHDNPWDPKPSTVREMAADRPDQTGTPFTVPKGFFHFESGIVDHERRLDTDNKLETFTWGEINAKYGLTDNLDLQVIWQPMTEVRYRGDENDPGFYQSGVNDLLVRMKYNLMGNDSGDFALAMLPYVKVPTAKRGIGNDMWEGGLILVSEADIGGGFTLGNSLGGHISADSDDTLYFRPAISAVLGREITEKLGVFVEIYSSWHMDEERYWQTSLDFGLDYDLTEHMILDAGVLWFFRGEETLNPFAGISWRF